VHVCDCGFCVRGVGVEDVCCAAVCIDCAAISASSDMSVMMGKFTLFVHRHIHPLHRSIHAKYLAQMALSDILRELLHHNLRVLRWCTSSPRSYRITLSAATPRVASRPTPTDISWRPRVGRSTGAVISWCYGAACGS